MKKRKRVAGRKNKDNFLKKNYSLSWHYIKESRNYILFIILVFLLAAILALFYQPPVIVEAIKKFIEELLKETSGLNTWQMIVFILNNNLQSSFVVMLAGILLGVFPFFTALANGYVLGFVAEKSVGADGISVLWRLFPHGIFELPAIFLALALGTKLGMFWFAENRKKEFLKRIYESLRVFLFVILPLLILAAIIEGLLIFVLG